MFVLAHTLVFEEATGGEDAVGLKWSMVCSRDSAGMEVYKKKAEQRMTPSTDISKLVLAACPLPA